MPKTPNTKEEILQEFQLMHEFCTDPHAKNFVISQRDGTPIDAKKWLDQALETHATHRVEEAKKEMLGEVWRVSDEIIAKCGVEEHVTDIYLADPSLFCEEEEWEEIRKSYGLPEIFGWNTPIALIALAIIDGYRQVPLEEALDSIHNQDKE